MKNRLIGAALTAMAAVALAVAVPTAAQANPTPSATTTQGEFSAQAGWVAIASYDSAAECDAARAGLWEPALCDRQVTDHGSAIWYLKVYRR